MRLVQKSQIHLKIYREIQGNQSYKTFLLHTKPSPIDYWITMIVNEHKTFRNSIETTKKTFATLLKMWLVQKSQIHLKIYREIQGNQSYKTVLLHTKPSPIDYWTTMIVNEHKTFRNSIEIIIETTTNEISKT